MKLIEKLFIAIAVGAAIPACQKSGDSQSSPPPQAQKQQQPQPPGDEQKSGGQSGSAQGSTTTGPRSTRPIDESVAKSLMPPTDELMVLLSSYLSSPSATAVPELAGKIVDEIFSEEGLIRPKIFEVQQAVAKVDREGYYTQESVNRIAMLQAGLQSRIKNDAASEALRDGLFIVGSSAVVGALAGTNAYENLPKAFPAMFRGMKSFASGARDRFALAYARTKSGVIATGNFLKPAPARAWEGVRNLSLRRQMAAEKKVYRNLQAFDLTRNQLSSVEGLERVAKADVAGFEFTGTDMAGFSYAEIDQWANRDLAAGNRRLLFEIKSMMPAVQARYVLSPEMDVRRARAIAAKLTLPLEKEPSAIGRFVYFLDPRDWTITPLRTTYTAFKSRMNEAGQNIKPLFARVDWPTAAGTTAVSGIVTGVWYYSAYDSGSENGERNASIDLEKLARAQPTVGPLKATSK